MLRSWRSWRRLSLSIALGAVLFGASVLVVSAQHDGGDSGQDAITSQEAEDNGGPPWEREHPCAPAPADPNGRGGPSWLCDHGGVLIQGTGIGDHPGNGRGQGRGVLGLMAGEHPGNGTPNWMRGDFVCNAGDEDGARGGPPWVCGDEVGTLGTGGVEKGPAWLRSEHPGRGHGRSGD